MSGPNGVVLGDRRKTALLVSESGLAQRRLALAAANRVRVAQADLKREVRQGLPLRLALSDERGRSIAVYDLLRCLPLAGRVKIGRAMSRARRELGSPLSDARRCGALTERERAVLIEMCAPIGAAARARRAV